MRGVLKEQLQYQRSVYALTRECRLVSCNTAQLDPFTPSLQERLKKLEPRYDKP